MTRMGNHKFIKGFTRHMAQKKWSNAVFMSDSQLQALLDTIDDAKNVYRLVADEEIIKAFKSVSIYRVCDKFRLPYSEVLHVVRPHMYDRSEDLIIGDRLRQQAIKLTGKGLYEIAVMPWGELTQLLYKHKSELIGSCKTCAQTQCRYKEGLPFIKSDFGFEGCIYYEGKAIAHHTSPTRRRECRERKKRNRKTKK